MKDVNFISFGELKYLRISKSIINKCILVNQSASHFLVVYYIVHQRVNESIKMEINSLPHYKQ